MRKLFVVGLLTLGANAFADQPPLIWQTPVGTFGIPFQATEALIGYDAVLKQAIGGFSLPVYTDPRGFVSFQLGAVAPWPNNQATIQPYMAAGHDIAREIPVLSQYQSVHLNVFARYVSDLGRAGVGLSASYAFGGGSLTAPAAPQSPPVAPVAAIQPAAPAVPTPADQPEQAVASPADPTPAAPEEPEIHPIAPQE